MNNKFLLLPPKLAAHREVLAKFCARKDFVQNAQNVHTPFDLCNRMIAKLWLSYRPNYGQKILTLNLEFVEVLIQEYQVKKENIWFITDCKEKAKILNHLRYKGVNLIVVDYLSWENKTMKFDAIVGNPPYNPPKSQNTGPNVSIWPDFVKKSFDLLLPNGFLCLVHPSAWRKPEHEIWPVMTSKQIHHLSMYQKGEIFDGAVVRADWYVLQNKPYNSPTQINDQDGNNISVDLRTVNFLSSGMIDDVNKIISANKEGVFEIVFDWIAYEPRREWISETKTEIFKYPCIHSITSAGLRLVYSNRNDNGHFGIKKVVINCGDILYPYNDFKGEYGMTQNSFGLVIDNENEGNLIIAAINTPKFKEIVKATKWGTNAMVEWRMFKYLKKDFWKQFVDEAGNTI